MKMLRKREVKKYRKLRERVPSGYLRSEWRALSEAQKKAATGARKAARTKVAAYEGRLIKRAGKRNTKQNAKSVKVLRKQASAIKKKRCPSGYSKLKKRELIRWIAKNK